MSNDSGKDRLLAALTAIGLITFGALWELRWRRLVRMLSSHQQNAQKWVERALHDPLTSLPNRTLLEDRLEQALIRAERNQTAVAVLFVDLDDFKTINDTYGHMVGDQMLIAAGQRFRQHLRASDTAARLGGDEFVVLLEVRQNGDAAVMVAERLRSALHVPLLLEPEPLTLTASIGIAVANTPGIRPEDLLLDGDRALLRAKQRGKDQIVLAIKSEKSDLAGARSNGDASSYSSTSSHHS